MPTDFSDSLFHHRSTFHDAVSRIQTLANTNTIPPSVMPAPTPASISPGGFYPAPSPLKGPCSLDSPFNLSPYLYRTAKDFDGDDDTPIIIDTFSPRPCRYDLSPPSSSASSDFGSSSTLASPSNPALGSDAFHKLGRFHLNSIAPSSSTSTFDPRPPLNIHHSQMLRASSCIPDISETFHLFESGAFSHRSAYTLSTNPPNPRTSFRVGDWICNNIQCAAHNFGRNISCIGCGISRSNTVVMPSHNPSGSRGGPSPRFTGVVLPGHQQQSYSSASLPQNTVGARPSHPLLTPSGRNFASGGRVQNISSDPMNPCIMYWPDNEPFPDQGQIRPCTSVGVPQPPIMNTGNRGPISHQPGDWICKKCNYLNWRRRKVCQTCLPYAEGNGDSISAAVQAERIALLTSVLAQTQAETQRPVEMSCVPAESTRTGAGVRTTGMGGHTTGVGSLGYPSRSHSLTPPQIQRRFADMSPPLSRSTPRVVHRSQSQFELGEQYTYADLYTAQPIYQTSGRKQNSNVVAPSPESSDLSSSSESVPEPAHLLPSSILHDNLDAQEQVVLPPSPALSPSATTSSSTDSSLDDYEGLLAGTSSLSLRPLVQTPSATSASENIWRFDGEELESRSLSTFSLPSHETARSSARKANREKHHGQDTFNNVYTSNRN
ncbi:hypothetical protein BDQ17DRAFT_387893 [Cyathus striatus]|nr:hypothetical protein BDQ17DRAFT_387893 [Cyathus striatus]